MTRAGAALLLGAVLVLGSPAAGSASGLELRLGAFGPRGESDLFTDVNELFGAEPNDFIGFTGGLEYSIGLGSRVELGFHMDAYGRKRSTEYVDYEHSDGFPIQQQLTLAIVPIGTTVRFLPAGRRARVSPYLSVGGGVYIYSYEETGEFVDFFTDDLDIAYDSFISNGAALGFHVAGGLRVALNHDFSLTGEVRWQRAEADMGDDFEQNRIDLGGTSVTLGFHVRF